MRPMRLDAIETRLLADSSSLTILPYNCSDLLQVQLVGLGVFTEGEWQQLNYRGRSLSVDCLYQPFQTCHRQFLAETLDVGGLDNNQSRSSCRQPPVSGDALG